MLRNQPVKSKALQAVAMTTALCALEAVDLSLMHFGYKGLGGTFGEALGDMGVRRSEPSTEKEKLKSPAIQTSASEKAALQRADASPFPKAPR